MTAQAQTLFDIAGIQARIHTLPGRPPFMVAPDLAEVYQTQPRRVGEAVTRNPKRFPEDFAFRLTEAELNALWSQSATTNPVSPMARSLPLAFTHAGAYALSGVLTSDVAIEVGIAIFRAFATLEASALAEAKFLLLKLRNEETARKRIRSQIVNGMAQGLTFEGIRRLGNYSGPVLAMAIRECLGMGLINALPKGMPMMQGNLFDV